MPIKGTQAKMFFANANTFDKTVVRISKSRFQV